MRRAVLVEESRVQPIGPELDAHVACPQLVKRQTDRSQHVRQRCAGATVRDSAPGVTIEDDLLELGDPDLSSAVGCRDLDPGILCLLDDAYAARRVYQG